MKKYEYLDHPADLKIRAFGKTLPKLFINAAFAITNFLYKVEGNQVIATEKVQIEAVNLEDLFINWLTEILYLSDANHLACVNFEMKAFDEKKLVADIGMISATAKDDIKAITYSELSVKKNNDIWEAIFVCDI